MRPTLNASRTPMASLPAAALLVAIARMEHAPRRTSHALHPYAQTMGLAATQTRAGQAAACKMAVLVVPFTITSRAMCRSLPHLLRAAVGWMCALFPPIQIATGAKEGTPGAALPLKCVSSKGLHPQVSILLSSNTHLEKSVFVPLSYTF